MRRSVDARTRWAWLLVAAGCCNVAVARADPAAAQALFDEARSLMEAKRYAEACPKFLESQRLDPGVGVTFHLANCYEKSGRIASAWALFRDVASQARAAGHSDRDKAATARADALEPRLPWLSISVPEASRVPGLEIRRNGILVGEAQWGSLVPVDPGKHEIVATAPGRQSVKYVQAVEEGSGGVNLELPPLPVAAGTDAHFTATPVSESKPAPASAPTTTIPVPVATSPAAAPADEASEAGLNPWGWGLLGLGAVGVGVGTALVISASDDNNASKTHCSPDPNRCQDQDGIDLRSSALSKADGATVAFIVGGAFLAGAGTLWLVEGMSSPSSTGGAASAWKVGVQGRAAGGAFVVGGRF